MRTKKLVLVITIIAIASASVYVMPQLLLDRDAVDNISEHTVGSITKIVDGDTLDIDEQRIRLTLVDTPERGDAGYAKATAFTKNTCPMHTRAIYDIDDKQKKDTYGRIIAKVWCFGDSKNTPTESLNAMLIDSDHGKILTRFCANSEFASEPWAKKGGC